MAGLSLDVDMVSCCQWGKGFRPMEELLLLHDVPLCISFFSEFCLLSPLLSHLKLARLEGEVIPEDAAEDDLGRGESRHRAGAVSVHQQGSSHLICV